MERTSAVRSLDRLTTLVALAEQMGYRVRYENLGGMGGGLCQFQGRRWLFIDLASSTADNLAGLEAALAEAIETAAGALREGAGPPARTSSPAA